MTNDLATTFRLHVVLHASLPLSRVHLLIIISHRLQKKKKPSLCIIKDDRREISKGTKKCNCTPKEKIQCIEKKLSSDAQRRKTINLGQSSSRPFEHRHRLTVTWRWCSERHEGEEMQQITMRKEMQPETQCVTKNCTHVFTKRRH